MLLKLFKNFAFAAACAIAFGCATTEPVVDPETGRVDDSCGTIIGVNRNRDVCISYVFPRYIEQWQTYSLWEALTGDEFDHGYLTFRTQPDSREGMYFFVMVDWGPEEIVLGSTIDLWVDSSAVPKVRHYRFTVLESHSVLREIKLGLTGCDWNGRKETVNAWKVVISTPSGRKVAEKQSWLWSLKDEADAAVE